MTEHSDVQSATSGRNSDSESDGQLSDLPEGGLTAEEGAQVKGGLVKEGAGTLPIANRQPGTRGYTLENVYIES